MLYFRVFHALRRIHRRSEVDNSTNITQEGKTLFSDQIFQIKPQTQVSRKPIKRMHFDFFSYVSVKLGLIQFHMYFMCISYALSFN